MNGIKNMTRALVVIGAVAAAAVALERAGASRWIRVCPPTRA